MNLSDRHSLGLNDCASVTGLSYAYLYKAVRSGLLDARYAGAKILVRRADLEAFVDRLPKERESA